MRPLKGNKKIEKLFSSGKKASSSFLNCVYLFNNSGKSHFVVSVPKKNFSFPEVAASLSASRSVSLFAIGKQ